MHTLVSRLFFYVLTLWAAITMNFFLPRMLRGDAVNAILGRMDGAQVTPEAIQSLRVAFGLDAQGSLLSQYFQYLNNIGHGELGISLSLFPQSVGSAIGTALPWTLVIVGLATLISFLIGTGLGVIAGWRRGTWLDSLPPISTFFSAMPYFWFGLIVIALFSIQFEIFPFGGGYSGETVPGWNMDFIRSAVYHGVLPAVTIIIASIGNWLVGMRNMMISTLSQDYLTLAEAKGLSVRRRALSYATRNAILPSISSLSLSIGFVVSGAVVTEIIFSYPGVGFLLYQAVQNRDFPLMQGIFLVITVAVLTANLLADVAYAVLDPRTRHLSEARA